MSYSASTPIRAAPSRREWLYQHPASQSSSSPKSCLEGSDRTWTPLLAAELVPLDGDGHWGLPWAIKLLQEPQKVGKILPNTSR